MSDKILESIAKRFEDEPYRKKFGMDLVGLDYGYSKIKMIFNDDLENILGIAHGGAIFSLMDEAFEMASNSYGTVAVALNVNVTFIKSPSRGDILFAEAKETSISRRIGTYDITVKTDASNLVARCQALVYRKKEKLPFLQ